MNGGIRMATSVREVANALGAIMNVLYLIEIDVNNPNHILKYVKMTCPSVNTLRNLLNEMSAAG
jgi:hypothetical protein